MVATQERKRILQLAAQWLAAKPDPITAHLTSREPVNQPHDFYSEAEYYWPVPDKPRAMYRFIDGKPNPDRFTEHQLALSRFSQAVSSLTAAYVLTREPVYAQAAKAHLRVWLADDATKMNSNPEFASVIRNSGAYPKSANLRGLLELVEVARSARCLRSTMTPKLANAVQAWFRELLQWMNSSDNGVAERDSNSVHALGWALQAAEYARLLGDEGMRDKIRERWRNVQLPALMASDGSFPKLLTRANSYSESVLAFDLAATLAWELSDSFDPEGDYPEFSPKAQHQSPEALTSAKNPGALLRFVSSGGQSVCKAAEFLNPSLQNKAAWARAHDAEGWDSPATRSPGLLFSGLACDKPEYVALWRKLPPNDETEDHVRSLPLRQPILWV